MPLLDFGGYYSVWIPGRSAWNGRPGNGESDISVFTDGPKRRKVAQALESMMKDSVYGAHLTC